MAFNYRFELMGNPEYLTIHTTLRFHDERFDAAEHELLPLVNAINGVGGGVLGARIGRNSICLPIGRAFDRINVGREVLKVIELWSGMDGNESGPVIHPPKASASDFEYAL